MPHQDTPLTRASLPGALRELLRGREGRELARLILASADDMDLETKAAKSSPIKRVALAVSEQFNVQVIDIMGRSRTKQTVRARWAAMFICRQRGYSFPHIGRDLGSFDHTTVVNGVRRAKELMLSDAEFAANVSRAQETSL